MCVNLGQLQHAAARLVTLVQSSLAHMCILPGSGFSVCAGHNNTASTLQYACNTCCRSTPALTVGYAHGLP